MSTYCMQALSVAPQLHMPKASSIINRVDLYCQQFGASCGAPDGMHITCITCSRIFCSTAPHLLLTASFSHRTFSRCNVQHAACNRMLQVSKRRLKRTFPARTWRAMAVCACDAVCAAAAAARAVKAAWMRCWCNCRRPLQLMGSAVSGFCCDTLTVLSSTHCTPSKCAPVQMKKHAAC